MRSARPTWARRISALARRSVGRHARVQQRQGDVVERAGAGEQVEVLEDEADLAVAHRRQFVAGEPRDLLPAEPVVGRRWDGRGSRAGS